MCSGDTRNNDAGDRVTDEGRGEGTWPHREAKLQTRLVALALAIFTMTAALVFHRDFAVQNQMIHFMKNLAIASGVLQIVAFGAGSISLDARGRS